MYLCARVWCNQQHGRSANKCPWFLQPCFDLSLLRTVTLLDSMILKISLNQNVVLFALGSLTDYSDGWNMDMQLCLAVEIMIWRNRMKKQYFNMNFMLLAGLNDNVQKIPVKIKTGKRVTVTQSE